MNKDLHKILGGRFSKIIASIGFIDTLSKTAELELRTKKPSAEVDNLIMVFQNIQKECEQLCEVIGIRLP